MGVLIKLYDGFLFLFFLSIALITPLFDAQICVPLDYFPEILVSLRSLLETEYGEYFFFLERRNDSTIAHAWIKLFLQWPLAIASLSAIAAGSSWLRTPSLIYGASAFTSLVMMLLISDEESEDALNMYFPHLVCTILAFLRGLLPHSTTKSHGIGKRTAFNNKKRA